MDYDRPTKNSDTNGEQYYYDEGDPYNDDDDDNYDSHVPVVSIIAFDDTTENSCNNNQLREESVIIMGEIASESIIRDVDYDIPEAVIHRSFLMVDDEEDNNAAPNTPNHMNDPTLTDPLSFGTNQEAVNIQRQELIETHQSALDSEHQEIGDIYQQEAIIGDAREGEILNTVGATSNIEGTSNTVHDDLPNSSETNDKKSQALQNNPNEKRYWCCGWMFRKS